MNRNFRLLTFARSAALAIALVGALTPASNGKTGGVKGKKTALPDIERVDGRGRIDWTHGAMFATGLGAMSSEEPNEAKAYLRARGFAKLDALRNLLMVIGHVHIDSKTTGADYEATSDIIRAEVNGVVRGAEVIAERKIRAGNHWMVEVTVSTKMYGEEGVAKVFLPEAAKRSEEAAPPPDAPEPAPPAMQPEAPAAPESAAPETGDRCSSVIIDTRGYKVERDMAPKIRRRDGSEVWGTIQGVNLDYVIEHGIVVYAHSMEEARRQARAGRNPLELHAVGQARGPFPADAVLSDEDADRLLRLNARDGFMNRFNVIFVVEPMH